jgi:hypothetical protein
VFSKDENSGRLSLFFYRGFDLLQQTRPTRIFAGQTSIESGVSTFEEPVPAVRVLRGREAILAEQPRLADLARATGQTGEVDSLAYFLSTPDAVKKTPCLLLFSDRGNPDAASSSGLMAAALLFEYRSPLGHTRVFATADGTGRRDLLAPPAMRARLAALAARTLIERGAHVVHLAFCENHSDNDFDGRTADGVPITYPGVHAGVAQQEIATEFRDRAKPRFLSRLLPRIRAEWALAEREIPAYLPLFGTFDATLARIGRRTRINLRYYRRRAEADLGASFVPLAAPNLEDMQAFNRECMYPVPESLVEFRHQAALRQPNHCVRGVRDGSGRWLSLVGTRRRNGFVEIDWQMNRDGHSAASLAIVMRSYLIEHEIGLGSTRLYMEGGTPQPISRSFLRLRICELTVKRRSLYVRLLTRFASFVFPPKNYIGQTLTDPDLRWRPW